MKQQNNKPPAMRAGNNNTRLVDQMLKGHRPPPLTEAERRYYEIMGRGSIEAEYPDWTADPRGRKPQCKENELPNTKRKATLTGNTTSKTTRSENTKTARR